MTKDSPYRRLPPVPSREGTGAGAPPDADSSPKPIDTGSDGLVLCQFADHAILCNPNDDKIGRTLMTGRPYQRRHLMAALKVLRDGERLMPGGAFVDVGANIGAMTIYALRSGAFAHGLALEPAPSNLSILRRNIALNELDCVVCVVAAAAGARATRAPLNLALKNHGAHSLGSLGRAAPAGVVEVRVAALDDLVADARLATSASLVKIDVEGHELEVLEGMPDLIAQTVPLMIEVTFAADDDAGRYRRFGALRERLGSCYRSVVDLGRAGIDVPSKPVSIDEFSARDHQYDLLIF